MRVFQILNDEVLIIKDKKEYKDSIANFKVDSGVTVELPVKSIYDDLQKLPVIQYKDKAEEWKDFPVQELETYIDSVQTYLDAKEKREYVEPTAEEKAAAEKAKLASEYEANKSEMLNALQSATLAGNTDAVASIQQDYKDMTAAYKEAVEGVTTA